MKFETDNFLFITNSGTRATWEEISPGVFKFKGRTTNEEE